jgi:hydrogenase maturation protein HypF
MSSPKPCERVAPDPLVRRRIRVRGIVQGVGFRPTVYRLAREQALAGWVLNDAEGVLLELEGPAGRIDDFLRQLRDHPPPLARITAVETETVAATGAADFRIAPSAGGEHTALVSPDMAICPDCLREMLDPKDRRFRYPFINCTNCGPRYSILLDIPYDRPRTTMRDFTMCGPCQAEYEDPADRRFHAQPNACPVCGPQLSLHDAQGRAAACEDPVRAVREALRAGRIVALKGLTGFHLAADARNPEAVRELRRRKGRDQKAFALMAASAEAVARQAEVGPAERTLLESRERPIVLVRKRPTSDLAAEVAPRSPCLGFMLPYAPLHYLIFEDDFPPLVMTSGNLSEEPICREDEEAVRRLAGIADLYLMHNRPIHTVCDDSVTGVQRGRPRVLRRGRGYAPRPLALPVESPRPILAVGAELKNAVCLVRGRQAFVSQHIGDLKNALAATYFETTIQKLQRLLDVAPQVLAHDLHPGYLSTRYAQRQAADRRGPIRLIGVQHHHAHIAGVMAENRLEGEVIGLAMDGTGYGPDGTVWGGEVLRASAADFRRLGHLSYVPLAGGDAAVEHPVRIAWAYLLQAFGPDEAERRRVGRLADVGEKDRRFWTEMIAKGVNSPRACGLGRLFDAVSVLADVCADASYEGQAAVELEGAAEGAPDDVPPYDLDVTSDSGAAPKGCHSEQSEESRRAIRAWRGPRRDSSPPQAGAQNDNVRHVPENSVTHYDFSIAGPAGEGWVLDTLPLIRGVVANVEAGRTRRETSARFHATVAALLRAAAGRARQETGLTRVALAGGCFANDRLVRTLAAALEADGFEVYMHHEVSPGDGGVALGQAYVAAARLRTEIRT